MKAVLNLQSKKDMLHRSVDWIDFKEYYTKNGIRASNFNIQDVDVDDLLFKSVEGAKRVNELAEQYDVIRSYLV